jgi:hypothetical protein
MSWMFQEKNYWWFGEEFSIEVLTDIEHFFISEIKRKLIWFNWFSNLLRYLKSLLQSAINRR